MTGPTDLPILIALGYEQQETKTETKTEKKEASYPHDFTMCGTFAVVAIIIFMSMWFSNKRKGC